MTNKNKGRRLGQGMKPRASQSAVVGIDVSANEGHATSAIVPVPEQKATVETGDTLAANSVQNLDSGKVAPTDRDSRLDDLLMKSHGVDVYRASGDGTILTKLDGNVDFGEPGTEMNPETGCISNEGAGSITLPMLQDAFAATLKPDSVVIGLPEPLTPESTVGEVFGGSVTITSPTSTVPASIGDHTEGSVATGDKAIFGFTGIRKATPEEMEKLKAEQPKMVLDRASGAIGIFTPGADHDDRTHAAMLAKIAGNAMTGAEVKAGLGERPDGTYGLVVTIPEGMIEPIREQAKSDKISAEEWVSTRLTEYLESWWQPAESR
jgi:hypothetical protein